MLKGRGRDPRVLTSPPPASPHSAMRPAQPHAQRVTLARPEPDYEVVEFPGEQYVNAKLQPPPPPPPRPPTGHPPDVGASCGLCGGGGARVRCAECGRRALCASCDDMYHRHPKRRNHQRQALSQSQLRDDRPPLPPKVAPPVPPPRRHKIGSDRMSASPKPPMMDQRRATLGHMGVMMGHGQTTSNTNHMPPQHAHQQIPLHLQAKLTTTPAPNHIGSMPYLSTNVHHAITPNSQTQVQSNTLGHMSPWNRQRGSLQGFNMHPNMAVPTEAWESPETMGHSVQNWGRPLRRGASVLELGGGGGVGGCGTGGCAQCAAPAPAAWRYGSCASLDHAWPGAGAWPAPCCPAPHHPLHPHMHPHSHLHPPQTPQPYRRADSRAASRAASRAGSRAASPAMSVRSRTSRRTKHRTPSPPPLPSSDADSESESESDHGPTVKPQEVSDSLGPVPPPPSSTWQCEHCTFVNEPGVRVCVICCRTPTTAARTITTDELNDKVERLKVTQKEMPTPVRVSEEPRVERSGEKSGARQKKERTSTGCGPSPPRDGNKSKKPINRLVTPTRELIADRNEKTRERHDMAVGPSPPREAQNGKHADMSTETSPPRDSSRTVRVSPYRDFRESPRPEPPKRHSISVGPSPPRENANTAVGPSPKISITNIQKKSTGTSPPRETIIESRASITSSKTNVSNTGTSPPPQSISTQTYEVPATWERAPSATRSRPRRRFRDDDRRERSHSRHSLSSDTRESERSVRTGGASGASGAGGRWEWRERDSSPDNYSRLSRRASHLDLRRTRPNRRPTYYGSEAASPERQSTTRAISLEALAGACGNREAERGMELAQLMSEAERLGFSAAEVQAALTQSPAAPLAWLRERWPSLCAGVRAAAARLAPAAAALGDLEARAALARHRGAMWPAVTECVERCRRQAEAEARGVGPEARVRGRVWGSPAGADDDAPPPRSPARARAEDSSDEFEVPTPSKFRDDDWMYLPLDVNIDDAHMYERSDPWNDNSSVDANGNTEDLAKKLKALLTHVGVPSIDENLLLKGLMSSNMISESGTRNGNTKHKPQLVDLIPSENDFIDAYNALTRSSPLPNINDSVNNNSVTKDNNEPPKIKSISAVAKPEKEQQNTNNHELLNAAAIHEKEPQYTAQSHQNSKTEFHSSSNEPKNDIHFIEDHIEQPLSNGNNILLNVAVINEEEQQYRAHSQQNSKTEFLSSPFESINDIPFIEEHIEQPLSNDNNVIPNQIELQPKSSNITRSEENIEEHQSETQSEEKSNTNLNDIVDNTQRLIQQMKEEINSDINSIDGRTMSHSEPESSSNEEQESSYSDTDDRSSDATMSDEKEMTTSEDEDNTNSETEKHPTSMQHRTSSEDNDNFEEALDHVENQLEDFKHANIEMLNSIARSLQEEHTATIEIHHPKAQSVAKQDLNNNLFTAVNTFEEIYEELNTKNIGNGNIGNIKPEPSNMSEENEVHYENIDLLAKQTIHMSIFKTVAPNKLLIFETAQPIFNATIEDLEEEKANDIVEQHNERGNLDTQQDIQTVEFIESEVVVDRKHRSKSSSPQSSSEELIPDIEYVTNNLLNDPKSSAPLETNIQNEPEENDTEDNKVEDNSVTNIPLDSNIITFTDIVDAVTKNVETEQATVSNHNNSISEEHKNQSSISNLSPDVSQANPTIDDSSNNKISSNKSNIPKLVKTAHNNNKTRNDKNSPKVIVSKVPVRRASLKQYPAPAPPKSHFGNIQSGHVKQLQTRLFNSKVTPPKVITNSSETVEVKASTSTLNKKKQAPPPPLKQQTEKQISPPKISTSPKKNKQFFRETCRTEDEWTDSDSEDSQVQIIKPSEEQSYRPPSPPPPVTVRRVSGQLIDLATVQLPDGSPERQARMLLAEGATETWEQAQIAVELISRGADTPAALLAALECADLPSALAYLYQDCELCASRLPEHEMVSMLRCTHRCCRECAHHYFTVQITERSIADCVCPYCKLPELENLPEDAWLEYFAHLDILLKTLLETDVHELFQRKLRDRTLALDPNFRWCMECSSGFFVHPKQKKIRCPECRSVSCASCRKTWSANHEGLTCEQYTAWLEDNDPERSVTAIQQHLRDNGLECPRCHFKYSLSRGGCMHFTCTQCKYEFCYGCGKPFTMGARCGLSEYCAKLGLHAHHPRNCLFYLRDKEPHDLQTLLQMNNVTYETEPSEGSTGRCPVQLQRETPTGLVDGTCGSEAPTNYAGLCKAHYVEYLAGLARGLDPIPIMDVAELVAELRRRALPLPERGPWDTDPIYAGMCAEIVKEKIPLD